MVRLLALSNQGSFGLPLLLDISQKPDNNRLASIMTQMGHCVGRAPTDTLQGLVGLVHRNHKLRQLKSLRSD